MRGLVERFTLRFADLFGSPGSFVLWCAVIIVWLATIPVLGLGHWNATAGLGGNTAESTVELIAEVAILIRASRTDRRTEAMQEHVQALMEHNAEQADRLAAMEEDHGAQLATLVALTSRLAIRGGITPDPDAATADDLPRPTS